MTNLKPGYGISIILNTSDFRGDHATDVQIAHQVRPGESIEELVGRLLIYDDKCVDFLIIRRVKE